MPKSSIGIEDQISWQKMQLEDHNLMIRLEAKVDGLIIDIRNLKDGTGQKLTEYESRIKALEKVHEEINPLRVAQEFQEVQQQVRDFRTIWKFMISIASIIGGVIGFTLSLVADSLKLFGR